MCESCKNGGKPLAAVWWRVSTDDQTAISPETQKREALALAEKEGFLVPEKHIIGTDWGSLSVWDSPAMERLKDLIRNGRIHAVCVYDPDRGPSKPAHRLYFRAMCEEHRVAVLSCHGQVPDGEMGEVMEFLSAWAKEKQVHRAQSGAKDGLRDRARLKGLPTNGKAPYGYRFRYDASTPTALEPAPGTYAVAARMWRMALNGSPLREIARVLTAEGLSAPRGGTVWATTTVGQILKNPVYAGRYYALRFEAVQPERRQTGYGKTSHRKQEGVWLKGFPIVSPVATWDEYEAVQKRMAMNKQESQRKARRLYVLAGMLFCDQHGRRLAGHSYHQGKYYRYECTSRGPKGQAECYSLSGPDIEALVWDKVVAFLSDPKTFLAEMERRRGEDTSGESEISRHLEALERKLRKVDEMETELVGLKLRGQVSEVAYERQGALLRAERVHHYDEMERQRELLATLERSEAALESLASLQERVVGKLAPATPEQRRWILQSLATRVTTGPDRVEISLGVPAHVVSGAECGLTVEDPGVQPPGHGFHTGAALEP